MSLDNRYNTVDTAVLARRLKSVRLKRMVMPLSKAGLRESFKERRAALDPEARAAASARIIDRLSALAAYQEAAGVAAFWPLDDEVDLLPLIADALAAKKRILLPRVNKRETRLEFCPFDGGRKTLAPGPFGLLEPQTPEAPAGDIDVVIVPGLAFDLHHHRLGYGAGYYDRSLQRLAAKTIGVAFDVQTIDILPIAEHDVALDMVVTESRIF